MIFESESLGFSKFGENKINIPQMAVVHGDLP